MKGDIFTFVKHNGVWLRDDYYQAGVTHALLIPPTINYEDFMKLLFAGSEGKLNPEIHRLNVKYETEGAVKPVTIDSDMSLACYLHIRKQKSDTRKFSLVLDILPLGEENDTARVGSTPNTVESGCAKAEPAELPTPQDRGAEVPPPQERVAVEPPREDQLLEDSTPALHEMGNECGSDECDESGESIYSGESGASSEAHGLTTSMDEGSVEVVDIDSPTTVYKGGMYANKKALQMHLSLFAIQNHFSYKTRGSTRTYIHVVCRDPTCTWAVRAVRMRNTRIFQIQR